MVSVRRGDMGTVVNTHVLKDAKTVIVIKMMVNVLNVNPGSQVANVASARKVVGVMTVITCVMLGVVKGSAVEIKENAGALTVLLHHDASHVQMDALERRVSLHVHKVVQMGDVTKTAGVHVRSVILVSHVTDVNTTTTVINVRINVLVDVITTDVVNTETVFVNETLLDPNVTVVKMVCLEIDAMNDVNQVA